MLILIKCFETTYLDGELDSPGFNNLGASLEKSDDSKLKLYYNYGLCNLIQFTDKRNNFKIYWFDR